MPSTEALIWFPNKNILFKSVPNNLIAILARVPESIASIRWEIGCPISILTPGNTFIFSRISTKTSSLDRLSSSKGASISDTFTPKACSSNSARPVFRATVFISGIESKISSAIRPILSDSSIEIPGIVLMLIVNEPSLNGGKKLLPNVKNMITAATRTPPVIPSTHFL